MRRKIVCIGYAIKEKEWFGDDTETRECRFTFSIADPSIPGKPRDEHTIKVVMDGRLLFNWKRQIRSEDDLVKVAFYYATEHLRKGIEADDLFESGNDRIDVTQEDHPERSCPVVISEIYDIIGFEFDVDWSKVYKATMTNTKTERLYQLQRLLLAHPEGITQSEIARQLGVHRSTAMRYIIELSLFLPIWEDAGRKLGIERGDFLEFLGLQDKHKRIIAGLDDLISIGEGQSLEFKVAACWNSHRKAKDVKMVDNIIKAVAGFMNSEMGGVVLIGIADDGKIVGLDNDYQVADAKKQNRDGYELFLRNSLNDKLGGDNISFYDIGGFLCGRGKYMDTCQESRTTT